MLVALLAARGNSVGPCCLDGASAAGFAASIAKMASVQRCSLDGVQSSLRQNHCGNV